MPRLRTIVAFLGGVFVAMLVGLVPPELIGWFRDQAARGDAAPDDEPANEPNKPRARKRPRRRSKG